MLKYNTRNNFMKSDYISLSIDRQRSGGNDLGIILFKPGYEEQEIERFKKFCIKEKIVFFEEKGVVLTREAVVALYPKIFSFSQDDILYGATWKRDTLAYLTGGQSRCILVEGKNVNEKLHDYKCKMRERYGKLTHPKIKLSQEDFLERVIKNLVHVIDPEELQNGIWLLFTPNEKT